MNRNSLWIALIALAFTSLISGCSGSSPAITVAVTAPASLEVSGTAALSATVTNDKKNGGVTWTCSPSPCGSFSSTTTASGATTTYTAPNTAGTVTITATSVTKSTITGTATITITAIASTATLSGNYTFLLNGWTPDGPYGAAGSFSADGNGNITAGEEDYADVTGTDTDDTFTGTYTLGSDGRGTIAIQLTNGVTSGSSAIGVTGLETFAFAVTSAKHAFVVDFDGSAVSSGTLDAQAALPSDLTVINGGYSFIFNGADLGSTTLQPGGGVLVADGAGNLNNVVVDYNDGGTLFEDDSIDTYTTVDTMGRGTMTLDGDMMAFYYVGPEVVRIVDIGGLFIENGTMYGQGATAASNSSLSGNYVFAEDGIDTDTSGILALAGQFSADGGGNLTAGVADINDGSGTAQSAVPLTLATAYNITAAGSGTFTVPVLGSLGDVSTFNAYFVDPTLNIIDPNNTSGGGGALLLDVDLVDEATGFIVPQSDPASSVFQGNYAFSLEYVDDFTASGQFLSDGVGTTAGTLDGENFGTVSAAIPLAGAWTVDGANAGRLTDTATLSFPPSPSGTQTYTYAHYLASSNLQVGVDITPSIPGGLLIIEHQ